VGSERVSMELMGSATSLRQGYGLASMEGKVARVATSKLGNERVSITNPAPNPGVIPGRCLQYRLLAIGGVLRSVVVAAACLVYPPRRAKTFRVPAAKAESGEHRPLVE
jgi:hypothetical protein